MKNQEEHIQDFYHLEPWKYQKITRYTWLISHAHQVKRDLVLYLGVWMKPFDPLQLKLQCYNVESDAYGTIYFRGKIKIQIHLDEQMRYVFEDTFDRKQVLLKCQDFDFQLEHVDYEHL